MRALLALTLTLATVACGSTPSLSLDVPDAEAARDASFDSLDASVDVSRDVASELGRDAASALIDDRFTERQWQILLRMSPVPATPPDPTNRFADNAEAAALGRLIFEDTGFSRGDDVACVTCHQRARAFTDGRVVAEAQTPPQRGRRNTPTLLFSGWGRWKLWDGGADTLWAQPVLAMENPREHDFTRVEIARRVATVYRARYVALFGALPPLEDAGRFPLRAKPGDAAWEVMSPDDQTAVNRVVANVGKALEAFERTLTAGPSPFDRYMAGERDAMTPLQRDGLKLFITLSCINCHVGPLFSDDDFHALRMPDDAVAGPDRGRAEGLETAARSVFGARSVFSDDREAYPAAEPVTSAALGRFRTPTLRGVALTAPYGHAGALTSLEEVIIHDAGGGLSIADPRALGERDPALIPFAPLPGEVAALAAFLRALTPDELAR